ncbi:MAG TPA: MFS transporter [Terriglobia bacterium]|nr:MFS transporter [Terriglobia bacterium]
METISTAFYERYLLVIAGFAGLLYGVDVGIISVALPFIGKTIPLSMAQTSIVVYAVLGGSMVSSLGAGILADWLRRKSVMLSSGALFLVSVFLIASSSHFLSLFLGRLLQGISGDVIGVVVPLFLAETLNASTRGRRSAVFQLMLTFGILMAAWIGWHYTQQATFAIAAAGGNATAITAAEDHAWRKMFLSVAYPRAIFFIGCFFLSETPRWLLNQKRQWDALQSLRRSLADQEAHRQLEEIQTALAASSQRSFDRDSLFQRRYVSGLQHSDRAAWRVYAFHLHLPN